jgi:hypothetical protein
VQLVAKLVDILLCWSGNRPFEAEGSDMLEELRQRLHRLLANSNYGVLRLTSISALEWVFQWSSIISFLPTTRT